MEMSARSILLQEQASQADRFLVDVLAGLRSAPKHLPCKYFYDAAGSRLYEQICALNEYYLNRAGQQIMRQHAREMAEMLGPGCLLIEYGPGSGVLTSLLLTHLVEPAGYVPIDLSAPELSLSVEALRKEHSDLKILPVLADFTGAVDVPTDGAQSKRRVVYFAGSTIGNFPPEEAVHLLRMTARRVGPGGGLLLGADLKKDPAILHAAYNDRQRVTAAFNLNLLARINRDLNANFQVDQFWHHALYNPVAGRIEMHLVSKRDQHPVVGGESFAIAEGESICTEYSYKYSLDDLRKLAAAGGFAVQRVWMDKEMLFSVLWLTTEAKSS
jgi:dimethylhistidine N-methyltransferase